MHEQYIVTLITLGQIWIIQIIILIRYVSKTNRGLNTFLTNLKYLDSTKENDNSLTSFKELDLTYNEIIDNIREAKIEKEAQYNIFQYTVENVGTGLISVDENGNVDIFNKAAQNIIGIEVLQNIKKLNNIYPELADVLNNLRPNQQKIVKINVTGKIRNLSVKFSKYITEERQILMYSLHDIKNELEENELDSWQKLMQVLTHEIMNSVGPVSSMANTLSGLYKYEDKPIAPDQINDRIIRETIKGLDIIKRRGSGLFNFVDSYRNISTLPQLDTKKINISDLFNHVRGILNQELKKSNISISTEIDTGVSNINADEKLVDQVLINLVKNSIFALENCINPEIILRAFINGGGSIVIEVFDNGKGISKEIIDKIFIPFFTTREKGTGIGLSLCRQIMRLHNGTISVQSTPGENTVFSLRF